MRADMKRLLLVVGLAVVAGCSSGQPYPSERQWQEGDIIHYHDGRDYENAVSIAFPHYRASFGRFEPTQENSKVHYHLSRNPRGPAGQYIRCFAHEKDGVWIHQPQWHDDHHRRHRFRGHGSIYH